MVCLGTLACAAADCSFDESQSRTLIQLAADTPSVSQFMGVFIMFENTKVKQCAVPIVLCQGRAEKNTVKYENARTFWFLDCFQLSTFICRSRLSERGRFEYRAETSSLH